MSQKSLEVIQISKDFSMTRFEVEGFFSSSTSRAWQLSMLNLHEHLTFGTRTISQLFLRGFCWRFPFLALRF